MQSYTDVAETRERDKQAELRRQIAELQAQLKDSPPATPAKRKPEARILAAGTPSPKKRKVDPNLSPKQPKLCIGSNAPSQPKPHSHQPKPTALPEIMPLKPSNLLSNLATVQKQTKSTAEPIERSTDFSEPPREHSGQPTHQERDNRLALVEKLMPGPQDHTAPIDDPHFERLEPNSGIYLSSRKLPHAELQDHLQGRYYLPPSLMYSVIRPLPSNQGYDVPVPGDWVTIAVIAEMGPIKLTSTSNTAHDDDDTKPSHIKDWKEKGKPKNDTEHKKSGGKKYMSLKLVDFGARSCASSAAPKAQVRGDALLTLLLFEADSWSYVEDENRHTNSKSKRAKVYKGGSGGAFEACMKLHEGAVIAIMNPNILKPYQRNSSTPHPTNNILAITPTSAQSIAIIGRSRDLGICRAMKRDGKTCGSWCDKRISDCCEYHIEHAVQRKRAGRPEFSTGTSGMTTTPYSRKPAFDPDRKWGLFPSADASSKSNGEIGATYVIPGHVIASSAPEFLAERIGRGRQEKVRRRREEKKADDMLNRLLGQDGCGNEVHNAAAGMVRKAREVMKSLKCEKEVEVNLGVKGKIQERRKSAYSAEAIKRLGFDPTNKGCQEGNAADVKRKLEVLASLQRDAGEIVLKSRPGKRARCGMSVSKVDVGSAVGSADGRSGNEIEWERKVMIGKEISAGVMEGSDDDELEVGSPV